MSGVEGGTAGEARVAELGKGISGVEGGTAAVAGGTIGVFGAGAAGIALGSAGGFGFADTALSVFWNELLLGSKPVTRPAGAACRLKSEIGPGFVGGGGRAKAVFSPGVEGVAPTLRVPPKSAAVFPGDIWSSGGSKFSAKKSSCGVLGEINPRILSPL